MVKYLLTLFLFSTGPEMDHVMHCAAIEIENGCKAQPTPKERVEACFEICDVTDTVGADRECRRMCDAFALRVILEITK